MVQVQALNYLLDTKNISFFNRLKDDMFSELNSEYRYIKAHIEAYGNVPDKETFIDIYPSFDLMVVRESEDYLIEELNRDKKVREVIEYYESIRKNLNDGKIDETIDIINSTNIRANSTVKYIDLLDASDRYDKYVDRCDNKTKYYITTGFAELDELIGGWDAQEELGVIVARANVGKSQLAIKCATAAVQSGLRVGIYSGEMSDIKVGYRVDTMMSHIPNFDLTHGDTRSSNEYKRYVDKLPDMYSGKLYCLTPDALGKQASVQDLKNFMEDMNLDILFVDQYSLLEDIHRGKTEFEKFSNLSKDLKLLQVMLHKPIIAVSQQNRGSTAEESIIDLSHISMSDRIGQDATTVLFLTCKDGVLDIYVSKSRDAEKDKKLSYHVNWNTGEFLPIDNDRNSTNNNTDVPERDMFSAAPVGGTPWT